MAKVLPDTEDFRKIQKAGVNPVIEKTGGRSNFIYLALHWYFGLATYAARYPYYCCRPRFLWPPKLNRRAPHAIQRLPKAGREREWHARSQRNGPNSSAAGGTRSRSQHSPASAAATSLITPATPAGTRGSVKSQ
jgi:hypothetical protein